MSAVSSIVMNDAQATPVAHTFIPLGQDAKGVWWFEDQSGASPIGYNRVSLQLVRLLSKGVGDTAADRNMRVKIGLHLPVLETLGTSDAGLVPSDTIAYIPRCNVEFIVSERSSLQQRKDLRAFTRAVLADTQVVGMIESMQNIY